MGVYANSSEDDEALKHHGLALAEVCEAELAGWVSRCVTQRAEAWEPGLGEKLEEQAHQAGLEAQAVVGPQLRQLLIADADLQLTSPLALLRNAVVFPTQVLSQAGVPELVRDDFAVNAFPDDIYDLSIGSFSDLSEQAQQLGIVWGAAKAHVMISRHRSQ